MWTGIRIFLFRNHPTWVWLLAYASGVSPEHLSPIRSTLRKPNFLTIFDRRILPQLDFSSLPFTFRYQRTAIFKLFLASAMSDSPACLTSTSDPPSEARPPPCPPSNTAQKCETSASTAPTIRLLSLEASFLPTASQMPTSTRWWRLSFYLKANSFYGMKTVL